MEDFPNEPSRRRLVKNESRINCVFAAVTRAYLVSTKLAHADNLCLESFITGPYSGKQTQSGRHIQCKIRFANYDRLSWEQNQDKPHQGTPNLTRLGLQVTCMVCTHLYKTLQSNWKRQIFKSSMNHAVQYRQVGWKHLDPLAKLIPEALSRTAPDPIPIIGVLMQPMNCDQTTPGATNAQRFIVNWLIYFFKFINLFK